MRSATDRTDSGARPRRLVRTLVLHVFLPGLFCALVAAWFWISNFVETDPRFCGQCHVTRNEYSLWTQSEHRNIVCQKCHHQSQGEALRVLAMFTFQGRTGDQGDGGGMSGHKPVIVVDACGSCHLNHDRNWPQIGESLGHKVHVEREGLSCLKCHARSIHKFDEVLGSCDECHEPRHLQSSGMEKLHCLACHNFLTREDSMRPARRTCLECHRSTGLLDPAFPENAPMATLECWSCHRPHQNARPGDVACAKCHDGIRKTGLHAVSSHDDCKVCHEAHTWIATPKRCVECHDDIAEDTAREEHRSGRSCMDCHAFTHIEAGWR